MYDIRTLYSRLRLNIIKRHQPYLVKKKFAEKDRIAFVTSFLVGDTLTELVLVNNLLRNHYSVDVYSNVAYQLRQWFPHMTIYPMSALENPKELARYSAVIHVFQKTKLSEEIKQWHPYAIHFVDIPYFNIHLPRVEFLALISQLEFQCQDIVYTDGIQLPATIQPRLHKNRIALHPLSGNPDKNWPADKFIALATELSKQGYEPFFIMSHTEKKDWVRNYGDRFLAPDFPSLHEVAIFISESGYFIGNDSGIGHLASAVGIPTLSIFTRSGMLIRWKPYWSTAVALMAPAWLQPKSLRRKFWKKFVSVEQVLEGFERLKQICVAAR